MKMIVWNDRFNTGVQQFDEHHQHLVGMLNQAYKKFSDRSPTERVENILRELVIYSTYHFEAKETWLHKMSYPVLDKLHAEHDRFLDTFFDMMKSTQCDRRSLLMEELIFLRVWLVSHIHKSVSIVALVQQSENSLLL